MLDDSVLKISPNGSFKITQLCETIAICEAIKGDRFFWGNATDTEPAFVIYFGCQKQEAAEYIQTFLTFYRVKSCSVRSPKYLTDFEAEIKVSGMKRHSDSTGFGLDYLIESEIDKFFGCNYDEYLYYCSGYVPRW
jgi:hypothetical protein